MAKLYKLTDENGQSYNGTQWGPGISHSGTGEGKLCGPGWIHAYTHPLLAALFNPIHANFYNPKLWEAKGTIQKRDHGLKVGCETLTTIWEIPLPQLTDVQRIAFGILAAKRVCKDAAWNQWAENWLSGKDRTIKAAARAEEAAGKAAWAAKAAAWAARAAAWAAGKAARAAETATWAARAAETATWAARAEADRMSQKGSFSLLRIARYAVKHF